MALNEYIQVLKRRWIIVLAGVLVGVIAGYLTAPGEGLDMPDYKATTTLVANPAILSTSSGKKLSNLDTAALLVTTGPVPVRVAKALGLPSADAATRNLTAQADPDIGSVTITAINKNAAMA